MKKLLILRHAKSDVTAEAHSDHERQINSRGIKNCIEIAELMRKNHLIPDLILSSTAKRAVETSEQIRVKINPEINISTTNRLYLAPPEKHVREIIKTNDEIKTLMIVGHNPAIEDLVGSLTGKNEKISTCTLTAFEIDIKKWKDFSIRTRVLKYKTFIPGKK
ncbi:MAG: histidine phosphatase family protein [Spirochaetes bacterium]|nr:histidine phosphatase family protein [Spirochaetota bacterium]